MAVLKSYVLVAGGNKQKNGTYTITSDLSKSLIHDIFNKIFKDKYVKTERSMIGRDST